MSAPVSPLLGKAGHVVQLSTVPVLKLTFPVPSKPDTNSKLQIAGTKSATSGLLVANGNNSFQVGLPTGVYKISAKGVDAPPAKLIVGPYRASSQNDLLLP